MHRSSRAEEYAVHGADTSVKSEDVYLRAYEDPPQLRAGLRRYFDFYNTQRRHSALDRRTPDAVYFNQAGQLLAA